MTAKTVNYTPEQTTQMVQAYQAGTTVEAIASSLGKTVRSVVAKLSREGVYKAKTYTTKKGDAPVKKESHVERITSICGLSDGEADSLAKANKTALVKILGMLELVPFDQRP